MVYVDRLCDRGWKLGANCHLIADSLEELHEFASAIGMRRAWFQNAVSCPHYDLTTKRRAMAVLRGAVELPRVEFVMKVREIRLKRKARGE